jgi:hypothetical protein
MPFLTYESDRIFVKSASALPTAGAPRALLARTHDGPA